MKGTISKMEEDKTCMTCKRLQEDGSCKLKTAREVEVCIANGLSHWSSIYNSQYEIDLNDLGDMK